MPTGEPAWVLERGDEHYGPALFRVSVTTDGRRLVLPCVTWYRGAGGRDRFACAGCGDTFISRDAVNRHLAGCEGVVNAAR